MYSLRLQQEEADEHKNQDSRVAKTQKYSRWMTQIYGNLTFLKVQIYEKAKFTNRNNTKILRGSMALFMPQTLVSITSSSLLNAQNRPPTRQRSFGFVHVS